MLCSAGLCCVTLHRFTPQGDQNRRFGQMFVSGSTAIQNCVGKTLEFILCPKMNRGKMPRGKGSDAKPRGRMTAYAFFVQTCREEHKKKHPDENVIFAEFSKKCAERWKVDTISDCAHHLLSTTVVQELL
ncbi:hypothetical protein ACI65C_007822 [Semiaphis heraclei]